MIILKPYIIFDILNHIKYASTPNAKIEITEKLQWILSRLHINAYIISNKSLLKEFKTEHTIAFMAEFMNLLLSNNREIKFTDNALDIINTIATYSGIKVKFYYQILQKMRVMFTNNKQYDGNTFLLMLRILNKFLVNNIHDGKSFPEKFFFFNNYNSEIKVNSDDLQIKSIPIAKGYTIGMWIYLEKITNDASNKKITDMSTLFYIHTNKYHVFEAYLNKNEIYYRSYNNSLENRDENSNVNEAVAEVFLSSIEYNKWTFLLFTHKPETFLQKPSIILYKNSNEPINKLLDYPNLNNQKITSLGICKDFTGLLSNVFMINESLSQPNIINDLLNYNYGFYNERNIRIFKDYLEKSDDLAPVNNKNTKYINEFRLFFDNIVFMYSPCRTKGSICKDLVDIINAEISTYSEGNLTGGVFNESSSTIYTVNGISILLPIFEFIFNSQYGTPVILEESLNLLINIFNKKEYYNDIYAVKKDREFFPFLQHIIEKYDNSVNTNCNLFTYEIMNIMMNIANVLIKNINQYFEHVKDFFRLIVFNPKIISKYDSKLQMELWKKVENLYKNNMKIMNRIFDATDIIELIIKLYDNNVNKYCCDNHFKMLKENEELAEKKIMNPNLNMKISNLISIARHIVTNSDFITINQINKIIHLLSLEISPCLQIELLSIYNDVFQLEASNNNFTLISGYMDSFVKNGGIEHLLFLISSSTLDVRFECLKLFQFLISNCKSITSSILEYIPYITSSFFPMRNPNNNSDDLVLSKKKHRRAQNSIILLEDEYWEKISSTNIIKQLNLPIDYVSFYSNDLNDNIVSKIYDFLMKWFVNKIDGNEMLQLDDGDEISFEPALNLLMQLVMYSNMMLKQKFLTNLYTLTQYNKKNCTIILRNKYFYQWLLDLLLPCQILKSLNNKDKSGLCETILSLGIKFHTCIIINSILLEQEIEKGLQLSRSFYGDNSELLKNNKVKFDQSVLFSEMMSWLFKIKSIGQNEGKSASDLLRYLILSLIDKFKPFLSKTPYSTTSPLWNTFLSFTLTIYEFGVMGNFDKKINESSIDMIEKNEIIGEIVQNLNFDYSTKSKTTNQTPIIDLWEDKIVLVSLYNCFKEIWNDSFFAVDKNSSSLLLDETKSISVLLQNKIFDEVPNAYISELSLLLYGHSNSQNILRCILNIIMIIIRLSESKDDISEWIRELEKFILFLIIASEKVNVDVALKINSTFLNTVRDSVAEAFVLTYNFLIEEMNSPRREERISNEIVSEFTAYIRTLFISFAFVIEKILQFLNEQNSQSKVQSFLTVLSNIKNAILMQPMPSYSFSPLYKVYNDIYLTKDNNKIFDLKDINEYRLNNFIEIPEKFKYDVFVYAFQDNPKVNKILKDHFCFSFFRNEINQRLAEGKEIVINGDICLKEKKLIDKVSSKVNEKIKNSLDIVNKNFINEFYEIFFNLKDIEIKWKKFKKKHFTWRGKWSNLSTMLKQVKTKEIKFKVGNHYANSLYCPLLYNIYDVDEYLPKFSKYNPNDMFIENTIDDSSDEDIIEKKILINSTLTSSIPIKKSIPYTNYTQYPINSKTKKSEIFANSPFKEKYKNLERVLKYYNHFYNNRTNKCLINLSELHINRIKEQNPNIKYYSNVCLLKPTTHTRGQIVISQQTLHFILYYPFIEDPNKKCNGELFSYDITKPRKFVHSIPFNSIKYVFKRRYYYMKNAIEIFTYSNKSFYFILHSQEERDEVFKLVDPYNNTLQIDKLIKEWEQWDISSFDLLMLMNTFGGRSFKDISQYPVFPWIISDYTSEKLKDFNEKTIRDLSKPIGALGSESRKENFTEKYNESEEDDSNEGKCFYSSHYSNPFYVTHYLYRLFPFSACAIELQGIGFDKPSRQFLSLPSSFNNCMNESTDIRELIPELFYFPEMFININNINFGQGANESCEMPLWAKSSPSLFTIKNRTMLESNYVSERINNWIDLIFGYKQKGKEAVTAMNLFFKFTYEDEINIDKITNEDEYASLISKNDFGQTPSQLFIKPFIKRGDRLKVKNAKIIMETLNSLRAYNSTSEHINSYTYKSFRKDIVSKMVIYIKAMDNDKVFVISNNGIGLILKANDTPYSESGLIFIKEKKIYLPTDYKDKENIYNKNRIAIVDEDNDIMKNIENNQPILVIKNGKYIIKGGYYDSKFLIFQTDDIKKFSYIQIDQESRVTSLVTDTKETNLFVGTTIGKIYIYDIRQESNNYQNLLTLKKIIFDHDSFINYMFLCNKLNVFASVSADKTCNLYSYPRMKIFNVIKAKEKDQFDYVFISSSPLPSIILFSKTEMNFYIYTINGTFIKKVESKYKILYTPHIITDNYHKEYLCFGTQDSCIQMLRLPLMEKEHLIEMKNRSDNLYFPIKCFDFSRDRQNVFYWQLDNFNLSVLKCRKEKKEETTNKRQLTLFDSELNI